MTPSYLLLRPDRQTDAKKPIQQTNPWILVGKSNRTEVQADVERQLITNTATLPSATTVHRAYSPTQSVLSPLSRQNKRQPWSRED